MTTRQSKEQSQLTAIAKEWSAAREIIALAAHQGGVRMDYYLFAEMVLARLAQHDPPILISSEITEDI